MNQHDEEHLQLCGLDESDLTALVRGELESADAARVRTHVAGCGPCAALLGDIEPVLTLTAARSAPAFDAAARLRLLDRLDDVLDGELDGTGGLEGAGAPARRAPVLPLLDRAASLYASSRRVRFLTLSIGFHAAAAVLLGVWLQFSPSSPLNRPARPTHQNTSVALNGEEDYAPLEAAPDSPLPPSLRERRSTWANVPLPLPENPWPDGFQRAERPLPDMPAFEMGSLQLFPNEEFRSWAAGRFRTDRVRRLKAAWGEDAAPRTEQAVARALRWLAYNQRPDGTWPSAGAGADRRARERFRVGVTAEALRALMADGQTAFRDGPYDEVVRNGLEALLRSADEGSGVLSDGGSDRPLCNHGPALAALSEAWGLDYGLLPARVRTRLRVTIENAVAATLAAQHDDGSFGYVPGDPRGDTSVTLLQVEGLEAARRAGFTVDGAALTRAGTWVAARLDADGRVGYERPGDRDGDATLTVSTARLARALGLEERRGEMLRVALREVSTSDLDRRVLYRTALLEALCGAGDAVLLGEHGAFVAQSTLGTQEGSGGFPAASDRYARAAGDALATALSVRGLTAPYRHAAP